MNRNNSERPGLCRTKFGSIWRSIQFKRLDILGAQFQLKYTKSGSFKTNLGAVFSTILVLIVLLAAVSTTLKFISTKDPEVSISTIYTPLAPKFDLAKEKIFVPFTIHADKGLLTSPKNPDGAEKFVTVIGFIIKETFDQQTGEVIFNHTKIIRYKPCQKLDRESRWFLDMFKWHNTSHGLITSFGLCPEITKDTQDYFVQSKILDPPHYTLNIYVYPCSFPDASQCGDLDQIKYKKVIHGNIKKAIMLLIWRIQLVL